MKYEQPYGVSDPNAAYINGNPSTGTMGSIPPAASIENPQREIVNFINDSGLTATDADLHQLSKSVQGGVVNYCDDQGAPNFIAITPVPAVAAYTPGQHFRIKAANANTGPTQLNVSNVGWVGIVRGDKNPIGAGEILAGQVFEVAWDGTAWQMLTGGSASGGLIQMTAPRSLYLNPVTGDDTLYDGTQATVDAPNKHGPFKTLKHALDVMLTFNLGGWTFTINFADGDYITTATVQLPTPNGSGQIVLHGNPANPYAVKNINTVAGSVFNCGGGFYVLDGLYLQATAPGANDYGSGVVVLGAGSVWCAAVAFGNCPGYHMQCGPSGGIGIGGPISIYGGGWGHIGALQNGNVQTIASPRPTCTINNAVTFSQGFAVASGGGQQFIIYTFTGAANVTGPKYNASGNGVINSGGSGVSYYPGTVAGSTSTGGQYI